MAYNPLDEYPQARKALYLAQWIVNLALGIVSIVLLAQDKNPQWFVIVQMVFNFVWTYTGITAQGNTPIGGVPGNPDPVQPDEAGESAGHIVYLALAVLLFLVVLYVILRLLGALA